MKISVFTPCMTLFFLLLLGLSSCAVSSKVDRNVSYVASDFSVSDIHRDGLALLPVVAGSGVEGYRRPFGEAMNQTGDSLITHFMKWNETMANLNDNDLVSEYNRAIQAYQETGIFDRRVLHQMSEATGKNFFFYVRLAPPTAERDVSYNAFTGGVSRTETKSVSAYALLWSASKGDVVWEGVATAEVKTDGYTYTDESDMDRAVMVARALIDELLNKSS